MLLAREFLRRYGSQHGKARLLFAPDARRAVCLHTWPGNVRELQNRVHRAVIMAEGKQVTAEDLEIDGCRGGRGTADAAGGPRERRARARPGGASTQSGAYQRGRRRARHQPADAL